MRPPKYRARRSPPQRHRSHQRPQKVRPQKARPAHQSRRYLVLWKPFDVLSQFSPGASAEQETLKAYVSVPDVYPAGRLDRDSEGLLLLTNDGLVQHKLCDPRFAHERTYWAQVEGEPSDEAIAQLCAGVQIKGYTTRPARVRRLESEPELPPRTPPIRYRANIPTTWLELTLTEGKNRQVRRMTAAVGHPTLRLVRAAFCLAPQHLPDGSCCVTLDGLSPGAWRELSLPASLWP